MYCIKCSGSTGLCAIGTCKNCKAQIPYCSDKLCSKCSSDKNQCCKCLTDLSIAVDQTKQRGCLIGLKDDANLTDFAKQLKETCPTVSILNTLDNLNIVVVKCNLPESDIIKQMSSVEHIALDW